MMIKQGAPDRGEWRGLGEAVGAGGFGGARLDLAGRGVPGGYGEGEGDGKEGEREVDHERLLFVGLEICTPPMAR
jgi:hypothetical protein